MLELLHLKITQAGTASFWFWSVGLAASTALALYFGFRSLVRARIIEDTPTSRIRSASQGYVELVGQGRSMEGPPIVSPLSGHDCLWYTYKVERRESSRTNQGHKTRWRTVESGTSDALFLIEDGTGACVIDPDGAEVTPSHVDHWYGNSRRPSGGPSERGGGIGHWLGRLISMGFGEYRYTERLILPRARLYALGDFHTLGTGGAADLKQETLAILRAWKQDPARMKAFDTDGDGQVDLQEWDAARRAAQREAASAQAQRAVAPVTHVLRKPASSRHPFLLATHSQRHLSQRHRLLAALSITGSILGGALAVWMWATRLSV
jgi:hypothetical protein